MKKIELNNHSKIYKEEAGTLNKNITSHYNIEMIKRVCTNLENKNILLLGVGDSHVNSEIYKINKNIVILEGSQNIIDSSPDFLQEKTILTYFEDYYPNRPFDYIIGTHILEHIVNPSLLLKHIKENWVDKNSKLFFTVPHANSLHRKIGVKMGLLEKNNSLNNQDIELGHQRVYSYNKFCEEFQNIGFNILQSGGFLIKMVSHKQMKNYSRELLDAIFEVSLETDPNICSNIWIEATI